MSAPVIESPLRAMHIGLVAYGIDGPHPSLVFVRVPTERGRWVLTDRCVVEVIHLEPWMVEYLERHGRVALQVIDPTPVGPPTAPPAITERGVFRVVMLEMEWLIMRRQRHMLLFTRDETDAMLLRSVLLPGQHRAAHEASQRAFAKGALWLLKQAMR